MRKYIVTLDDKHIPSIADACRELEISRPSFMHKLKANEYYVEKIYKNKLLIVKQYSI